MGLQRKSPHQFIELFLTSQRLVSCSQTAIFSFILGPEKIGSGTLMIQFLFSLPLCLGWVMIGVNADFLNVLNFKRAPSYYDCKSGACRSP